MAKEEIKDDKKDMTSVKLRVVEALQDDAYRGIARIDPTLMKKLKLQRGDIISLKGSRETFVIVDRAYPADLGENIIRIDGITRKNAKTSISEMITIKRADLKEAKKVTIAPAQQGIMVQGDPEGIKQKLIGMGASKGDLLVLGAGNSRQKRRNSGGLMDEEFGDMFSDFSDIFNQMGMTGLGNFGGATSQIRFIVASTTPNQPGIITENTELTLSPKAIEVSEEGATIPQVTYEDIGGLTEEVKKIREMVELPLKHPEIFDKLGIEPPKGVLLYGPPGTGKTMLAKAVAGETEAHFILLNGPEIMSKFYGESEKKVREVFDEAEKNAPAIIFIDEIDSIAPKREEVTGEVERRVVSQLLTMMDGLNTRGKVVVIAATNRPNALDQALRRPGRFDREIEVGVPDKKGRKQILKIHTRGMPIYHWDTLTAGKIMQRDLNNFEEKTKSKCDEINEKIKDTNIEKEATEKEESDKIEKLQKQRRKMESEMIQRNEELAEMEREIKKHREESIIHQITYAIRNKKTELKQYQEEIESLSTQLTKTKANLTKAKNDYEKKIEEFNEIIQNLKKDITTIKRRNEQVKENKKILDQIIPEIEELRHQLIIRDSEDIRTIFYSKKLEQKDKVLSEIIEDLINTEVISENYMSEVIANSVDLLLDELAAKTHGFVGADISSLAKEAAMAVLRRNIDKFNLDEESEIPQEKLKGLEITKNEFEIASKTVRPSAMREVFVETPNVKWSDVGGIESAKQELQEAVEWPMKSPESFERMGIKPPKGILLYGPPGTGKTMLAKAVAKESEANFIQVKGPELLSMWVGKSEEGVRKMFERARQVSPCIIFFDEIDSLAGRRGGMDHSGNNVTERVLNQLLAEMDGIETLKSVIVIGATNRPDMLDPALLRPGRFDRIVYVPVPEKEGREAILNIHTKNMPLEKDVDLKDLAEKTEGYTGADIEGLCREAAMLALRKNHDATTVSKENFEKAMEKVSPSVTKNDQDRYRNIEKKYLRSAKSALPETSYAG